MNNSVINIYIYKDGSESNHISVSWVIVPYLGTIFFCGNGCEGVGIEARREAVGFFVACRLLARARALVPTSAALHFLSKPLPKESWHLEFFWKMVGSVLISAPL